MSLQHCVQVCLPQRLMSHTASVPRSCNEHSCASLRMQAAVGHTGRQQARSEVIMLSVKVSPAAATATTRPNSEQQPGRTLSRPAAAGYTGRQPRPDQVRGTPALQDPSHLVNINDLDTPRPATTGIPGYGGHQLPAELAARGEAGCGGLAACQAACMTAECTQLHCLHRRPFSVNVADGHSVDTATQQRQGPA